MDRETWPVSADNPSAPKSVLGKVDRILEALSSCRRDALGLSELARQSGLSKATAYRLVTDLVSMGLLERTDGGFGFGPRLFEIGQQVPRYRGITHAAAPYAEDLHVATQQTVHMGMREGNEVIYVLKVRGMGGIDKPSRVAGRMPMHCTATGRALLAALPDEDLDDVIAADLKPLTRHTIVHPGALHERIHQARRDGVATEVEEVQLGLAAVAAPVVGRSGPVAAISVTVPLSQGRPEQFRTAVRTTALTLSRLLSQTEVEPHA